MRPGRLVLATRRLVGVLGEGVGLAGALAVAAWGEIRATRDVDIVTTKALADVEAAFRNAGIAFQTRRGDPAANDLPWVISGELDGASFQVFAPRGGRPFATVDVFPARDEPPVPVVDLPDLLRLKLEAGGPKDLWDVARLVRRHPGERNRVMTLARELGLEAELARWIERDRVP